MVKFPIIGCYLASNATGEPPTVRALENLGELRVPRIKLRGTFRLPDGSIEVAEGRLNKKASGWFLGKSWKRENWRDLMDVAKHVPVTITEIQVLVRPQPRPQPQPQPQPHPQAQQKANGHIPPGSRVKLDGDIDSPTMKVERLDGDYAVCVWFRGRTMMRRKIAMHLLQVV